MNEQRLALAWHLLEALLVLSLVGVIWSITHQRPRGNHKVSYERANAKR